MLQQGLQVRLATKDRWMPFFFRWMPDFGRALHLCARLWDAGEGISWALGVWARSTPNPEPRRSNS